MYTELFCTHYYVLILLLVKFQCLEKKFDVRKAIYHHHSVGPTGTDPWSQRVSTSAELQIDEAFLHASSQRRDFDWIFPQVLC